MGAAGGNGGHGRLGMVGRNVKGVGGDGHRVEVLHRRDGRTDSVCMYVCMHVQYIARGSTTSDERAETRSPGYLLGC